MNSVLITGCASGIGAAVAQRLAGQASQLVLHTASNAEGLRAVSDICETSGARVQAVVGDLCDSTTIESLVSAAQKAEVNALVLNAGFPDWRDFESLDSKGLTQSLQVMATANYELLEKLTPTLKRQENAKVLAVSSFLAHKFKVGANVVPASATAKAALEAMIKSYAAQYADAGICANIIVPGYIKKNAPTHTPPDPATLERIISRIPAGRLGRPQEVAALAAFLLSDQANYITGQAMHIDGGLLLQ